MAALEIPVETTTDPSKPAEGTQSTSKGNVTTVTADASALDTSTEQKKPDSERPAWLPEKFKTPEDFAKSYAELEKKLGTGAKPDAETQKATDAVEKAGVDLDALSAEFAKDGKLSEASYASLEKAGLNKATVDAYIKGQQAVAEAYTNSIAQSVGGMEALNTLFAWAKTAMTPGEIAEANKALASGNTELASMTVKGIQARYIQANGKEPALLEGNRPGRTGPAPFRSNDEIVKAMSDKRYATDEAYRKDVESRMAVTELFSIKV